MSNSAWINEISNPTHELMGTMDAMGAAVASTTKASFSRDTMHALMVNSNQNDLQCFVASL